MSAEHPHHLENPNATTPPPKIELISSVPSPPMPDNAERRRGWPGQSHAEPPVADVFS